MQSRKLGNTGPEVSSVGFGCMGLNFHRGPAMAKADAVGLLRQAVELGVTLFDTAECYGPFTNEEIVWEALRPVRDRVLVATKFGFRNARPSDGLDSRPERIRQVADECLRRLRVDYIDVFFQHRPDPAVPMEDVAGAVQRLISEGKVRHFGLCEVSPQALRRAHAVQPVAALQSEYSLWWRALEAEMFPVLEELGVGLVSYSPLGRGFLTGTMTDAAMFEDNDNRSNNPRLNLENRRANQPVVDAIETIAQRKNATAAQVALAWILARRPWIVPIPGTTKLHRVAENLAAVDISFSAQELTEIDSMFAKIDIHGERYTPSWGAQVGQSV